jgi:hypothetical protein
MDHFALIISLFALDNIFWRNSSFRKINVTLDQLQPNTPENLSAQFSLTLLFVHSENYYNFISSDTNELLDTSDSTS